MNNRDDAFWWANLETENLSREVVRIKLASLKDFFISEEQHTSLFHKQLANYALFRLKSYKTSEIAYCLVENYEELVAETPDLVNMLLRSGEYVYQKAAAKTGNSKIIEFKYFQ